MKKPLIFVLLVTILAACAPGASSTNSPAATETPAVALATVTLGAATLGLATQIAPSEEGTALPVATSRGPELHATDPASVSLVSGGLQFVEFFRFT